MHFYEGLLILLIIFCGASGNDSSGHGAGRRRQLNIKRKQCMLHL